MACPKRSSGRRGFISCPLLLLILFLCSSIVEGKSKTEKAEVALYYETLCPYCSNFIVNGLKTELFKNNLISIIDLKLVPYGNARVDSNGTISCQLALPSDFEKVSIEVYYESLCPYSANFIGNYLVEIFLGDLLSIIELNLVPWGTWDCQHGPSECLLNTVEACALNIWPELSDHFPLIYCIEELVHEHNYTQWESCFKQLGLNATAVSDCYTSGHGKELELKYAAETDALQPPHQYVPWVVVNGEPLYDDYENFASYVCKAYSGTSQPESCSNSSVNPMSLTSMKKANEVCHRRETTTTEVILPRVKPALESRIGWM